MLLKKCLLMVALLGASLIATAHDYKVGELLIEHPWSREMPPVAPTAAAYFILHNPGASADRLLSVSSPVAAKAEMHEHVQAEGMMSMRQVESVVVPAGGEVRFEPMGYHVMLFNLKRQAKDGERFPLTLNFEKAGSVAVLVTVQKEPPAEVAQHQH